MGRIAKTHAAAVRKRSGRQKTIRGAWTLDAMGTAVKAVKEGQMSIRHAASSYGVPKSTLERHINGKVVKPGTLGGKQPVLDKIFENQLVVHVLEMQSRFFGITPSDLKRLAFQLAMRNNIIHPFSKTKESSPQALRACGISRQSTSRAAESVPHR